MLTTINDFSASQYQRVVLNAKVSEWSPVNVRVAQGSIFFCAPGLLQMKHSFLCEICMLPQTIGVMN